MKLTCGFVIPSQNCSVEMRGLGLGCALEALAVRAGFAGGGGGGMMMMVRRFGHSFAMVSAWGGSSMGGVFGDEMMWACTSD